MVYSSRKNMLYKAKQSMEIAEYVVDSLSKSLKVLSVLQILYKQVAYLQLSSFRGAQGSLRLTERPSVGNNDCNILYKNANPD